MAAQNGRSNNASAIKDKNNTEEDEQVQPGMTVDGVYNELIHLRKMNKILGDRIKQLEVMNFRMTNQGFTGVKNQKQSEPNRPIFSSGTDGAGQEPTSPMRINSF